MTLLVTVTLLGSPLADNSQCKILWGKTPTDSSIISNKVEFTAPTGFPGEFVDVCLEIDGIVSESALFQYDELGNVFVKIDFDNVRKFGFN